MRAARTVVLALLVALPGCLLREPTVKEVHGETDGYTPTAAYLKVHVWTDDDRVVLLDFDRRDWHVSGIAKRLDGGQLDYLSAQALPRDILGEYVVQHVGAPGELAALRYDAMAATPEQRADMDAEYERLLRDVLEGRPPPGMREAAPLEPKTLPKVDGAQGEALAGAATGAAGAQG